MKLPVPIKAVNSGDVILIRDKEVNALLETLVASTDRFHIYVEYSLYSIYLSRKTGLDEKHRFQLVAYDKSEIDRIQNRTAGKIAGESGQFSILEAENMEIEGSLFEIADTITRRVRFHIENRDFDGALRIIQQTKDDYFTRKHELEKAAKNYGIGAPISLLGFSNRVLNCLEKSGCKTIFELCQKKGESIVNQNSIGPKTYEAIREVLDTHNFDHLLEPLSMLPSNINKEPKKKNPPKKRKKRPIRSTNPRRK